MAAAGHQPPEVPTVTVEAAATATATAAVVPPPVRLPPVREQDGWLDLIGRFQKLHAPEFAGGSDPLVADRWKEDVGNILDLLGVTSVQRHRLAAFTLKGDASKWYRLQFTEQERVAATWEEFVRRFDLQYISSAARGRKGEGADLPGAGGYDCGGLCGQVLQPLSVHRGSVPD